jgi:hypothetical protein
VPFLAKFRGQKNEVKNYADILLEECGGAVLSWMIEGAARVIENHFRVTFPSCVTQALEEYKGENTLYKNPDDGAYYLLVRKQDTGPEQFNRICNLLSEYAMPMDYTTGMDEFFREHMKVIVADNAMQSLRGV